MAAKRNKSKALAAKDPGQKAYEEAVAFLNVHPLFHPLLRRASVYRSRAAGFPADGWVLATIDGDLRAHPTRRATKEEWIYALAHGLLHLGFEHLEVKPKQTEWNLACDCVVTRFLLDLKLGRPWPELDLPMPQLPTSEERLYEQFCSSEIPEEVRTYGTAGPQFLDMVLVKEERWHYQPVNWKASLAAGLAAAVSSALKVTTGRETVLGLASPDFTAAMRAKEWFISSYPLLGAMAARFAVIEDMELCRSMEIRVAAVDAESCEVFINPVMGLGEMECRFVLAHELLHVGLRHPARRQGRDPFLWNVACDYVINGWLLEMGLGQLPSFGGLYDPELKGLSAEAIYDRMVTDLRRFRKLATLRGTGLGDILERGPADWWEQGDGLSLDGFYRRCLSEGLAYHEEQGRGLLPAGLIEEIRALSHAPIPWDVELAQWFDNHFAPLEKRRSYARPSRRQSSTPDIPRPSWQPVAGAEDGRTFGVVMDTSLSMDRRLLAKALGAIASYSMSREVPAVRVVFCDAVAYDQGYMPPESIAGQVKVKGRGGTRLQPAIDLLARADDFPKSGPILIITDGQCDRLNVPREHAFLIPAGARLPFVPKGKVFRVD